MRLDLSFFQRQNGCKIIRRTGLQTRPDLFLVGFLPSIDLHFIWFGDYCSGILADLASDGKVIQSGRGWRPVWRPVL